MRRFAARGARSEVLTHQVGRDDRDDPAAACTLSSGLRLRGRGATGLRLCGYCGLGALALVCVALGGFFLALWAGPINLTWLAPRIVSALDRHFAGQFAFSLKEVPSPAAGMVPR